MWYSDPFLILPSVSAQAALISFVLMLVAKNLEYKVTAIIAAVVVCALTFASVFLYSFGYFLRHAEETNIWLSGLNII